MSLHSLRAPHRRSTRARSGAARCLALVAALAAFLATGPSAVAANGARQDLTDLFAPPTAQEIAAVRADWASRPIVDQGFQLEATGTDADGVAVHVISHVVDGQRHYAGIRFPRLFSTSGVYRTMLLCHGGLNGVDLDDTTTVLTTLSGGCIDDDSFLIVPSFRGEVLTTSFAGAFASGGMKSPADRDVDDVLSLLTVALRNYPQMDEARVSAWGLSRGSSVALLAAVRDPRVRRVCDNFGFTDLSLPSVRARVDDIQNFGVPPAGIGLVTWEASVSPYLSGGMTLAEARLAWIRRSVVYFADDLPDIQAHHGLADTQVDVSHTTALLDELALAGVFFPAAQGYFYPGGQHSVGSLPGYGPRARDFLCEGNFVEPRGYCGPMNPTSIGLYTSADYRGSSSITASDFVFRANDVLPNSVGLLFVSAGPGYTPAGAGYICLGSGLQRVGIATSDASGVLELPVDFTTADPYLDPLLDVGVEAHFQLVFRDTLNPFGPYNFSNGLAVTILP